MIRFEFLTVAARDPSTVAADYRELVGCSDPRPDAGDSDSLALENIQLQFETLDGEGAAGIRSVGLVGEVDGQVGRWTLDSASLSATSLEAVAFAASEEDVSKAASPSTSSPTVPDPSAVHAVDHIVIRSRDVDATRRLYEQGFGLRVLFDREFPDWKVRLCMCRVGDAVLEIAGSLGREEEVADHDGPRDRLWGVTWRVRDIEAAHGRLLEAGFDVSDVRTGRRPGTRVFTVRDRTGGVPTLIIQPAD